MNVVTPFGSNRGWSPRGGRVDMWTWDRIGTKGACHTRVAEIGRTSGETYALLTPYRIWGL